MILSWLIKELQPYREATADEFMKPKPGPVPSLNWLHPWQSYNLGFSFACLHVSEMQVPVNFTEWDKLGRKYHVNEKPV